MTNFAINQSRERLMPLHGYILGIALFASVVLNIYLIVIVDTVLRALKRLRMER